MVAGDITSEVAETAFQVGSAPALSPVQSTTSPQLQLSEESISLPAPSPSSVSTIWDPNDLIAFKLRDPSGIGPSKVTHFVCSSILTVGEFLRDVSSRINMTSDSFDVIYQNPKGETYTFSRLAPDSTFDRIHIIPIPDKEYSLSLTKGDKGKKIKKQRPVVRNLDAELDAASTSSRGPLVDAEPMVVESSVTEESENYRREFVGLRNQMMTCYLNSLLQGLFFCPEFRNMIYNQVVEYDPDNKSIIGAFQRLFLQMQFSVRSSISTDEITQTFGWKKDEVSVQHDIDEFYRILLDSMGQEFKFMRSPILTDSLLGGIVNDYVQCMNCNKRNSKKEMMLSLSLPIRIYGSSLPEPTLVEAIKAFVQYELLTDDNRYNCSRCGSLQNARKGLCIQKLPYLMCVNLKRSEYDFNAGARRKIHDKVAFPFILDMNPFMECPNEVVDDDDQVIPPIDPVAIGSTRLNLSEPRSCHSRPAANEIIDNEFVDKENLPNGMNRKLRKEYKHQDEITCCLKNGPNVYQLLAVLIHRGSSSHGGHYFAYLFDLEKNQWNCCNDAYVSRIDETQVFETFGTDWNSRGDEDFGQAYMLIYRRVDPTLNVLPMTLSEMPDQMKELWASMEAADKELLDIENYERTILRLPVYIRQVGGWDLSCENMIIQKSDTMEKAAHKCFVKLFPGKMIPFDYIRLVRFNLSLSVAEESFEGCEKKLVEDVYKRHRKYDFMENLLLEIREPDMDFDAYTPQDIVFKANLSDYLTKTVIRSLEIHALPSMTLQQLKGKLAKAFQIENVNLTISHRQGYVNNFIVGDTTSLASLDFDRANELIFQSLELEELDPFLKFVEEWYHCFVFEILCEVPVLNERVITPEKSERVRSPVPDIADEDTLPLDEQFVMDSEYEFDPNEIVSSQMVICNTEVLELPRDCSDHSASEDSSLTGSERTMVGPGSPTPGSIIEEVVSGIVEDVSEDTSMTFHSVPDLTLPVEEGEMTYQDVLPPQRSLTRPNHLFRVHNHVVQRDKSYQKFVVRAAENMPLSILSHEIGKLIHVEEANFIMYRIEREMETECVSEYHKSLRQVPRYDFFRVRLGHRLKENEGRFPVYLFEPTMAKQPPKYMKEVILNWEMSGKEIMAHVVKEVDSAEVKALDPACIRLRRKKRGTPGKILRDNGKIKDLFPGMKGELFVQVLDCPEDLPANYHSVFIRHYYPSTCSLGPPYEFLFRHSFESRMEELLCEQLEKYTGIPDLECALPEVDYPFELNPLTIQESLVWKGIAQHFSRRLAGIWNDEAVIFLRDATEVARELSPEERRAYALEAQDAVGDFSFRTPIRRSEPVLRINLARTPPA